MRDVVSLLQRAEQAKERARASWERILQLEAEMRENRDRHRDGWITRQEFNERAEIIHEWWALLLPVYSHAWNQSMDLAREADELVLA